MDSVHKRVAQYRQRMLEAGLRPVQVWVPDSRRRGFGEECRRQSISLRSDPAEKAALELMDRVTDWGGGQ